VVTFLTTLGNEWTNWSRNPTFVVVSLKLQAYLSAHRRLDVPRNVGAPIELQLPTDKYRKEVTFVVPSQQGDNRATIDRNAVKVNDDSPLMTVALGGPVGVDIGRDETGKGGIYEAWAFGSDGKTDVRRFAVNVESAEGDLALVDPKSLLPKLEQVNPKYLDWDELDAVPVQQAGFNWGRWILLILIVLLILEQLMAYAVSYHPIRGGAR
jgi:hypothetical protein